MSTKARPGSACFRAIGAALLCALAGACAAPSANAPPHAFSAIRLGRQAPPPSEDAPPPAAPTPHIPATLHIIGPPSLRPPIPAPAEPAAVLPVTLATATDRVAAWLGGAGFAVEQRPDGAGELVSATRMGSPIALQADAVCGLEAMHRPDISSTDLTVRLTPAPGGVQVQADARFIEVDTKILSGDLSRQTCRSRGHLEAAVRRAALGG